MERATLVTALMIGMMAAMGVAADEPGREFNAMATMRTSQGTNRMPVTLIAARFTSIEDATVRDCSFEF